MPLHTGKDQNVKCSTLLVEVSNNNKKKKQIMFIEHGTHSIQYQWDIRFFFLSSIMRQFFFHFDNCDGCKIYTVHHFINIVPFSSFFFLINAISIMFCYQVVFDMTVSLFHWISVFCLIKIVLTEIVIGGVYLWRINAIPTQNIQSMWKCQLKF